jgi:hypothetical protein
MADGCSRFAIDFENFDIVLEIIKTSITPAAYRSLKGWTKKTDSTIFKSIETMNQSAQTEQKKGLLAQITGQT